MKSEGWTVILELFFIADFTMLLLIAHHGSHLLFWGVVVILMVAYPVSLASLDRINASIARSMAQKEMET